MCESPCRFAADGFTCHEGSCADAQGVDQDLAEVACDCGFGCAEDPHCVAFEKAGAAAESCTCTTNRAVTGGTGLDAGQASDVSAPACHVKDGAKGFCFSGDSTVTRMHATTRAAHENVPLADLAVGDKIQAVAHKDGRMKWAAVTALPHSKSEGAFVDITVKSGADSRKLSATEHHTFPSCKGLEHMVPAHALKVRSRFAVAPRPPLTPLHFHA